MFDLKKFFNSFRHAFRGLGYLLIHEQNFQFHLMAGILALLSGIWLSISYYEFLILLLLIAFVFMAEIVNTVIEYILDIIHPDYHKKIKIVKDATAGVVLFASLVAIIIGLIIFIPKLA
jgi:diacylglycerol kinase